MISVRNASMLKYCFTSLITRFNFPYLLWPRSPKWHFICHCCCCSVTQSCPTLQPHGLQHARPPCPSPSPEVCPSSYSLHRWCRPAILSFDALFSFWTLRCPRTSAKRLMGGIRSPGTVKLEGGFQTATYQHRCPQTPVSVSQGRLQLPPASPGSSPRSAGGSDQQTGPRVCAL